MCSNKVAKTLTRFGSMLAIDSSGCLANVALCANTCYCKALGSRVKNVNDSGSFACRLRHQCSFMHFCITHLGSLKLKIPCLEQFPGRHVEVWRDMTDFAPAGLLPHDVCIWGIEAQGCCRQPIGHQVDPQQLHRVQRLWHAQQCCKEDGDHLPNIGGDHVANELQS